MVYEGTETDAQESFVSRYFWPHVSRLELTFHVIQFTVKAMSTAQRTSYSSFSLA